jgi:hypothetical protein
MPRSAKLKDTAGDGATLADLSKPNSTGQKLRSFLDRAKSVQGEIDAIMDEAKLACEPHREDMKALKKEANEAGFAAKEFATLVRKERLEGKIERIAENLDDDQKERFEDMLAALGALADLPLGMAVVDQHPEAEARAQ